MLLIAILHFLSASTFTISKAALTYGAPIFYVAARMIIGGAVLLGYYWFASKKKIVNEGSLRTELSAMQPAESAHKPWHIPRQHYGLFAQTIFFYIYLTYVFDLVALNHMGSAKACLLYDLSPFICALLSYWVFNELMTPKKWLGLSLGYLAFIPVLLAPSAVERQSGLFGYWPEILMLGAVAASSYGWIVVRELAKTHAYASSFINGFAMMGGGILALITSLIFEEWGRSYWIVPVTNMAAFVANTALIIIISNFLFSLLYTELLKKYTATLLSFAGFTAPLFAAGLGWLFLNETVGWDFFATALLVVIGLYIFYQEELKQGYYEQPTTSRF